MKHDKWTQQLHDKLAEHETPAPADLWADIEAALPSGEPLDGGQHLQASQHRKARFVALRRWAAAAAVAAMVAGGGLVWWEQDDHQAERLISMAEEEAEISCESIEEEPPHIRQKVKEGGEQMQKQPSYISHISQQAQESEGQIQDDGEHNSSFVPTEEIVDKSHSEHEETSDKSQSEHEETSGKSQSEPEITSPLPEEPVKVFHPRRKILHRPTIGFYAMNSFGSQDNSNAVMMADALARNYTDTYAAVQASRRQAPIFLTGYEERQHHHQPLSFGLTLSYPLTKRLSLTSGIVYTRLKSEFIQTIHSQQFSKDQTLHYVGIPLSLNYRLWQYKGFRAYVAVGMQADWNVKAQLKAEGVDQEMGLDRMQWSANASLGVQYDVLPQLSLYAEPGIDYHFDNGSAVQNFFKDKPTSMKLQMGIRLNLKKNDK